MTDEKQALPLFADVQKLLPELESIYKDIHSHPELSMQENRTAGIAADYLQKAGYEVTKGVGKTGVVGLLRNGDGPTVMLRADMDALPVKEATGEPVSWRTKTRANIFPRPRSSEETFSTLSQPRRRVRFLLPSSKTNTLCTLTTPLSC